MSLVKVALFGFNKQEKYKDELVGLKGQKGIDAAVNNPHLLEDWIWDEHAPKNSQDHIIARNNLRNNIKKELIASLKNEEVHGMNGREAYHRANSILDNKYKRNDSDVKQYGKMYNKYIPN